MKKFLSFLLAFVMMATTFVGVIPPLEVSAAAPDCDFDSVTKAYYGDEFEFEGEAQYDGSRIDIVHVDIHDANDGSQGVSYYRETGLRAKSFDYSDIDSFTVGDVIKRYDGTKRYDTSDASKLLITIYTKAEDGQTNTINHYVTLLELGSPEITSHDDGDEVELKDIKFQWSSVSGADDYEYELYDLTDDEYVDDDVLSQRYVTIDSSDLVAGHEYEFSVRAIRDAGAESDWESIEFSIKEQTIYPSISGFDISTDELTESGKITVSGTINGNGETIKTVQVNLFNEDGSKGGSIYRKDNVNAKTFNLSAVPAITMSTTAGSNNMKLEPGKTYKVVVFVTLANGKGFTSDPTEYFDVKVPEDKSAPLINPIKLSASKIPENSTLEISTAASDNVGLKSIQLFINNEKVKEWSAKGTYATISHAISGYSEGTYTVKVIAIDQNGNQNTVENTFTVEKKQGGEIYSVEMSTYEFTAGTTVTFTVTTSVDTEKIRLRNGLWAFPNAITNGTVKDGKKIWVFDQYVDTPGVNRVLSVETYSGGWTGNTKDVTFTVNPAEKLIPAFEITGFADNKLTWTTPNGVSPDKYVVNVGGPSTYSVEVTSNNVILDASVFALPGSYSITVTAQKAGYTSYTASTTVTFNCEHKNLKEVSSKITNKILFDDTYHTVTLQTTCECQDCGAQIVKIDPSLKVEHTHDTRLDESGWVCSCGYVNTGSYKSWTGYLQSDTNQPVYSNPKSFINANVIGTIFTDDVITVLGECGDAYYVRYNVTVGTNAQRAYTNGNTKSGYIPKEKVDSVKYDKGSVYDIYVDGKPVLSNFHNNNTLYSDLNALLSAIKGVNSVKQNGKYELSVSIAHPAHTDKTVSFFVSFDDSAATHSWSNITVQLEHNNNVEKELLIGSYIYLDRIFIETDKFMEYLDYSKKGKDYHSPANRINDALYENANDILELGNSFDVQFSQKGPEWFAALESGLHHIVTFDIGDICSDTDYANRATDEIVSSIEEMLMKGAFSPDQESPDKILFDSARLALSFNVVQDGMTYQAMQVALATHPMTNEQIKQCSATLSEVCAMAGWGISSLLDGYELYQMTQAEGIILDTMLTNLKDNLLVLQKLKKETLNNNPKMYTIYSLVEEKLLATNSAGIKRMISEFRYDSEIRNESVEVLIDVFVDLGVTIVGIASAPVGAAIGGIKIIDMFLQGEDFYQAQDGIYAISYSIGTVTDELNSALTKYYNDPTDSNATYLIQTSLILGDLKIKGLDYYIQYIDGDFRENLVFVYTGGPTVLSLLYYLTWYDDHLEQDEQIIQELNDDKTEISKRIETIRGYQN